VEEEKVPTPPRADSDEKPSASETSKPEAVKQAVAGAEEEDGEGEGEGEDNDAGAVEQYEGGSSDEEWEQ